MTILRIRSASEALQQLLKTKRRLWSDFKETGNTDHQQTGQVTPRSLSGLGKVPPSVDRTRKLLYKVRNQTQDRCRRRKRPLTDKAGRLQTRGQDKTGQGWTVAVQENHQENTFKPNQLWRRQKEEANTSRGQEETLRRTNQPSRWQTREGQLT